MLNQSGITKVTAATRKTILYDTKMFFALPIKVSGTKGTAYSAGMPVAGDLSARDTAFTVSNTSPVGILEHDIVIGEDGTANAGVIVFGFIDYSKLDDTAKSAVDTAKADLPKITFCV